ncbi:ABC-type transport auxiliary lipoprotein family protein [Oxalobacteraceae bacterium A2-2]
MTSLRRTTALVSTASALALLLGGCASGGKGPSTVHYDFGPLQPSGASVVSAPAPALPAIVVTDISGPASLDSERMHYRLLYADARQARPYAYNEWSATPLQLLTQRIKARIAQSGIKVLSSSDTAASGNLLRMEVDDFAQNFDSATSSSGQIVLRASVFNNRKLVDQKTFTRSSPAPSADAAGGARALADATDLIAADLLAWLGSLPLQR